MEWCENPITKESSWSLDIIIAVIVIRHYCVIVLIVLSAPTTVWSRCAIASRTAGRRSTQLKQRTDLIPNLVETVKGYAAHESQVFTQVTQARAGVVQAAQSGDVAQRIAAENQLSRALINLQAVSENVSAAAGQYEFPGFAGPAEIALKRRSPTHASSTTMSCRSTTPRPRLCRPISSPAVPFRTGPVLPGGRSGSSGSAS